MTNGTIESTPFELHEIVDFNGIVKLKFRVVDALRAICLKNLCRQSCFVPFFAKHYAANPAINIAK